MRGGVYTHLPKNIPGDICANTTIFGEIGVSAESHKEVVKQGHWQIGVWCSIHGLGSVEAWLTLSPEIESFQLHGVCVDHTFSLFGFCLFHKQPAVCNTDPLTVPSHGTILW